MRAVPSFLILLASSRGVLFEIRFHAHFRERFQFSDKNSEKARCTIGDKNIYIYIYIQIYLYEYAAYLGGRFSSNWLQNIYKIS